jgi:acetyl esterase/lipase
MKLLTVFFLLVASYRPVWSAESSGTIHELKAIPFAEVDGHRLLLDLYRPTSKGSVPVIVWVHGGAWRRGSRDGVPIKAIVSRGFAIASVDYRLSPVAKFPAQIHDIKAAIRFLRANAATYELDPDRITIAGASAGGHLAALAGVAGPLLEGNVGEHDSESSRVSVIISFYGASNLQTILTQSTPHGLNVRVPALQLLLGGQPAEVPDIARLASPVAHLDRSDPPLLLVHGDQDPQMPINQAHELHGGYKRIQRPVEFDVIHGAAHGGEAFYTDDVLKRVAAFLTMHTGGR